MGYAKVNVFLNGTDISQNIDCDMISFSFTDNEADEADDLQVKIADPSGKWLRKWLNAAVENAAEGGEVINTPPQEDGSSGSSGSSGSGGSGWKVTASRGVNVRSSASTKGDKLGKIAYGTIVDVQTFGDGWAQISFNGGTGWVKSKNLEKVGSSGGSDSDSSSGSASTYGARSYSASESGKSSDSGTQSSESSQSQINPTSRGLKISAEIVVQNRKDDGKKETLDCGEFELDSVSADGPPQVVTLKATSLPYSSSIRQTSKSKSWENVTLSDIANTIANDNGMGLLFQSNYNPSYERVEQYRQTDIAFLSKLCKDAGESLKVTSNSIVIFDRSQAESGEPVRVLKFGGSGRYSSYKLTTGTNSTYTSCRVSYTTSSGEVISATEYAENYSESNGENQCLEVRQYVTSIAEAQMLAHKLLRLHNTYEYQASFTMQGDPTLAAGCLVALENFGAWDGNYIIEQAKHSIGSSGFTTQIKLRKALGADTAEPPQESGDSDDEITDLAMQVIRGDWDNGQARYDKLTAAGHDYDKIQAKVNEILYG